MAAIRILPDLLANQIAAGEVVERPASVIKELVENALDAQSSRILIDIEEGGRSLIRVADNGCGMEPDDALLCLERFATSKLGGESDLFAIRTLGFRGEALPSIASVSHLTLITRSSCTPSGVQVEVRGGQIRAVTETGAPQGTMVSVGRLFFNTPARRKFLKGIATELGHIADTVAGMALGWPQVYFRLSHNAKILRQWPQVDDPADRVADVLGQISRPELIDLTLQDHGYGLTGYVAPARLSRATTQGIYIFVNGRRVRDRVVQHALVEGFHGRLIKGRFPMAVLFLQVPFDQVDVNVHPAKHEIRFADQRRVHTLVQSGVAAALEQSERSLWAATPAAVVARVQEPRGSYFAPKQTAWSSDPPAPASHYQPAVQVHPDPIRVDTQSAPPLRNESDQDPRAIAQTALWPLRRFADLTVIGQFRSTYIICQSADGDLILIDQHAAHERIVYERLSSTDYRIDSQVLLMPSAVELGFAQARALEPLLAGLNALGLEIEPFGGTTFVVKAVPSVLAPNQVEQIVVELAEKAAESGKADGMDQLLDQCRMVMACHRSVRANQALSNVEIGALLVQLDQCERPGHCPHGRPTWIRWTVRDLEKAFFRID